jgi:hypothetical protein
MNIHKYAALITCLLIASVLNFSSIINEETQNIDLTGSTTPANPIVAVNADILPDSATPATLVVTAVAVTLQTTPGWTTTSASQTSNLKLGKKVKTGLQKISYEDILLTQLD